MTMKHTTLTTCLLRIVLPLFAAAEWSGAAEGQMEDKSGRPSHPRDVPGLICFWDFSEPGGQPRRSQGPFDYALEERNGPVQRVEGGVWGAFAARIEHGQWFRIERSKCPALDLHGPGAQFTILAWVKRLGDYPWQFVAGMWNESAAKRQYALFTSGVFKTNWRTFTRTPTEHRAHAYVSAEGGGTPGKGVCFSYSTGATFLELDRWYFLAATYDQKELRAYVNGKLDTLENHNPFHYPGKPIFDGGPNGSDFTVAQRAAGSWADYPEGRIRNSVGFSGVIGGLAVYRRALSSEEIDRIHAAAQSASSKHLKPSDKTGSVR